MNTQTRNRILFLQQYLRTRYKRWWHRNADNIVGFRIDKKITNGKESRNYAIIFQVIKKKAPKKLAKTETIPPYIDIVFPDGKKRRIKTDVEQVGKPRLQQLVCRKPLQNGRTEVGTAGLILEDGVRFFALTNYHVAAKERMRQGSFRFKGADPNIFVDGNQEVFVDGIFSTEIDAAFIELSNIPAFPNQLRDGNVITAFLTGPLSPSLIGRDVKVYSRRLQVGASATVKTNSATFFTGFQDLSLVDVVQLRPRVTRGGDSGGAVVINGNILIGIVVGADDLSTYVVPFFKINDFRPLLIA